MYAVVVANKLEYEVAEAAEVVKHCMKLLVNAVAAVEHCWSCWCCEQHAQLLKAVEGCGK